MSLVITLLGIGVVLLAAEVFVPGGILGGAGGLFMVAGCISAFMILGSGWGIVSLICGLLLLAAVFWFEYAILPRTKWGGQFFLKKEIQGGGIQGRKEKESLVGESAVAVTALAPSGYVMVKGKRYEATSQSGFINEGEVLYIVAFDQFNLIVRKK